MEKPNISKATAFFEATLYPRMGTVGDGLLHAIESIRAIRGTKPLLKELIEMPKSYAQLAERILVREKSLAGAAVLAKNEALLAKKLLRAHRSRDRRHLSENHPLSIALAQAEATYARAAEPFMAEEDIFPPDARSVYDTVFRAAGGVRAENKKRELEIERRRGESTRASQTARLKTGVRTGFAHAN